MKSLSLVLWSRKRLASSVIGENAMRTNRMQVRQQRAAGQANRTVVA
jgi:hypothetical protein